MSHVSLALVGFGNVGRAFARLILHKEQILSQQYGITFSVTAIATGRHGMAVDPKGINLEKAIALVESGQNLDTLSTQACNTTLDVIRQSRADVLLENSPVNYESGQPAVDHLRAALELGMHAVTANKGPVVHAYHELTALAKAKGRCFLFESTVMDGAPIFSLFRAALPSAVLSGFEGILNSCTNLILECMENGKSFEESVAYAQSIGIAETDPSGDIDGWDAAIKVAALLTVLMDTPFKPQQVDRHGIRSITPAMIRQAAQTGERWKLICRAARNNGQIHASVKPEKVTANSPLYTINGTSSYIQFHLDTLPGLGIVETNPGPETTAFGLLTDIINAIRGV
ncbi:MAG: homoserine dehydrogenase [Anaerolineae bacterium]|nr:homoserine dehydrogenase [Anaerolineae bacterium]